MTESSLAREEYSATGNSSGSVESPAPSAAIGASTGTGSSQIVYTIIPETTQRHDTVASAQPLPDLRYFGVVGTIGFDGALDLYRMHLNEGIGGLDFRLAARGPDLTSSIQFMVLDGSGQVLASSSSGGQVDSTIHLALNGLPAGTTIFLGIAANAGDGAQAALSPISYQLWVDRLPAPARSIDTLSGPPNLLSVAVSALLASPVVSLAGAGLPLGRNGDPAGDSAPSMNGSLATNLAVGSLAIRSARPSGGLLSEGDATISAPGDAATSLAQDWTAASHALPTASALSDTQAKARSDQLSERDLVVQMPGPGGFPLLAATAVGHGRKRSLVLEDAPISTPPSQDGSEGIAEQTDRLNLRASLLPVEIQGEPASVHPFRVRSWGRFPASLFSGLGIATVLTLNALLSQPIAGFDYLTTRFDASGTGRFARRGKRGSEQSRSEANQ
jgi:hypothetical protein